MSLSRFFRPAAVGFCSLILASGLASACSKDTFSTVQEEEGEPSNSAVGGQGGDSGTAPGCPEGELSCDGECVNPTVDSRFCGASGSCSGASAGKSCGDGDRCEESVCVQDCPSGLVGCDGECVDPMTDDEHCGATLACSGETDGAVCNGDARCVSGGCKRWLSEELLGESTSLSLNDVEMNRRGDRAVLVRSPSGFELQLLAAEGDAWAMEEFVAPASSSFASLALDETARLHTVWSEYDAGISPTFGSFRAWEDEDWSPTRVLPMNIEAGSGYLHLSLSSTGDPRLVVEYTTGGVQSWTSAFVDNEWQSAVELVRGSVSRSVKTVSNGDTWMAHWTNDTGAIEAALWDGAEWAAPTVIGFLDGDGGVRMMPAGTDDLVAVWNSTRSGANGARFIRFDASEGSWGDGEVALESNGFYPRLVELPTGELAVGSVEPGGRLAFNFRDPVEDTWGSGDPLALAPLATAEPESLRVVASGSQGLMAAWIEDGEIYLSDTANRDSTWSVPIAMTTSSTATELELRSDARGRALLVWLEIGVSSQTIRARRFE